MPFTVPPSGGFFEQLVYALTTSSLLFYAMRIWGGPSHEASILAAETALVCWAGVMAVLTLLRRLGRRPGDPNTGEFPAYRGPDRRR